jgi:hypothetical protein
LNAGVDELMSDFIRKPAIPPARLKTTRIGARLRKPRP